MGVEDEPWDGWAGIINKETRKHLSLKREKGLGVGKECRREEGDGDREEEKKRQMR